MNSVLPIVVALGILSFFWWVIRVAKRQIEERRRIAEELGFTRAEEIPQDFVHRVEGLHGKSRGQVAIRNLFIRGCGRYDLYVFDLVAGRNTDHSEWTAAIVSHDLKLPLFRIFPAMPFTGMFATWIEKMVSHMATKQGFAEYRSALPSQFAEKYRLFVADEHSCTKMIPSSVWGMIAELKPTFTLQGQDDCILFTEFHREPRTSGQGDRLEQYRQSLRTVMEQSDRLHRIFFDVNRMQLVS